MSYDELLGAASALPMNELIKLADDLNAIIEIYKHEAKQQQADVVKDGVKFKYSSYIKLKPKDINAIIEQYPIAEYPDIYNISLAKGASSVITDEDLFEEQVISSVRVEL